MAPRGHRTGPVARVRSVNSKIGVNNMQFTKQDPVAKGGKKGHERSAHVPRTNSAIHEPPQRAAQIKAAPNTKGTNGKAAFTLATSVDDDEGDWVSSESGAATPAEDGQDSYGEAGSPIDQSYPTVPSVKDFAPKVVTPRAEKEFQLPRIETAKQPLPRVSTAKQSLEPLVAEAPKPHIEPERQARPRSPTIVRPSTPPARPLHRRAESEAVPATETSPPDVSKRSAHARPASMVFPSKSISRTESATLRPHPLIRGLSYGQPAPPQRQAPLTTISVPEDHDSSNYSNGLSSSPTSFKTTSTTSPQTPDQRRLSISSTHTLPLPHGHDRVRTLSTVSSNQHHHAPTSSFSFSKDPHHTSLAALNNLAHPTRPSTPQMVTYFPTPNPRVNLEAIHPLLPLPYLTTHLSVLNTRNPMRESWERVMRAKKGIV